MPTIEEVSPGTIAAPPEQTYPPNGTQPVPAPAPIPGPAAAAGDLFTLTTPVEVGGRIRQRLEKLHVNGSALMYNDYAEIKRRYIREVPKDIRKDYDHESEDPEFLKLVICKLNPPMIVEDFARISMADAMGLFTLARGLIFSGRFERLGPENLSLS